MRLFQVDQVVAFSTPRNAADPADPYSGFNACDYVGDSPTHIAACRRALADGLGLPLDALIFPRQTHGDRVALVDRIPYPADRLRGVDALVTALPDVLLCISTADCVPLLMADPDAGVIAAVHAGWRGVINRVALRAIVQMQLLGADPARILVAMGPSICPACFEVGQEVADQFEQQYPDAAYHILNSDGSTTSVPLDSPIVRHDLGPKPHVDLARALQSDLYRVGIQPKNVQLPLACTCCDPDRYFSARRLGVDSGRVLSGILRRSNASIKLPGVAL